jgi:serine/threonine protein kinase
MVSGRGVCVCVHDVAGYRSAELQDFLRLCLQKDPNARPDASTLLTVRVIVCSPHPHLSRSTRSSRARPTLQRRSRRVWQSAKQSSHSE